VKTTQTQINLIETLLLTQHSALKIKYRDWSKGRAQLSISSINYATSVWSHSVTDNSGLCAWSNGTTAWPATKTTALLCWRLVQPVL